MLGLLGEEEDISLGHTHLEILSGYPQVTQMLGWAGSSKIETD